jgi:general secretion pathway protein D
MATNNPIISKLGRSAVILAGVLLISPLIAGDPAGTRGGSEAEHARREVAVQEAQELLLKGDQAYKSGNFADAAEAFAGARELLPDAPTSSQLREAATDRYAQASVEQARVLSRNGDIAGARTALDKVLADGVAPGNVGALAMRAQLDDPIRTNPALTKEHAADVDAVRRALYSAQGAAELGKYDEAKSHYEKVLRIDPTNTAARRGLEQVAAAKSGYQKSASDHTRAEMLSQVEAAWETQLTETRVDPNPGDPGGPGMVTGPATVSAKLDSIIIPKISFDQVGLQEALDFLRNKSVEFDTTEADASLKGVNFTLNLGSPDGEASKKILAQRFDLQLNSVPLSRVVKYVTDMTQTAFTVDDFAVLITPLGSTSDELVTRTYRVPPDFITSISTGKDQAATDNPFAADEPKKGLLTTRMSAKEALEKQGIPFPEGASASYSPGTSTLRVFNTATNQDMISQIVQAEAGKEPAMVLVQVTMIRTQETVLEELGFDTLLNPLPLNADGSVNLGGGTVGNGSPRNGGDFVTPVGGVAVDGVPANPLQNVNPGLVNNGNRSGGYAIDGNALDAIVNNINRTGERTSVAPGILSVTGLFTDAQVQTIMRGLDQKKGTDIMARPSVVTRSGQQSSVSIIREFIYPTEYEPPQIPTSVGDSGGQSTPITPATPTAFEKKDVGIFLEVLPVADLAKGFVDVTLNPSFSDFDGFVNYGTPINTSVNNAFGNPTTSELTKNAILMPVFSIQRLNTQLSVFDGATIAIGGLLSDSIQDVEDRVPVLGDIPLIGRMFSTKAKRPVSTAVIFLVRVELQDPTGRSFRNR